VTGWCGVDHHHLIVGPFHDLREGAEHGDLLCAGGAQILFYIGDVLIAHAGGAGFGEHLVLILLQLHSFIDMAHGNATAFIQHEFQVRSGVGSGEVDFLSALGKSQRHGGGHGGLTHTPFAHCEDDAFSVRHQFVDHVV